MLFNILKRALISCVSACLAPLNVGYHTNRSSDLRSYQQDGFISSWIWFIMLTSFIIFMSFGHYLSSDQTVWIQRSTLLICQCVFMGVTILVMLLFMCCVRIREAVATGISSSENYGNEDRVELENTRIYNPSQYYCKRITKKIIPIIGIVIFQLGNIILDVSYIIGNAFCLDDLHSDHFMAYHIQAAAEIAFHIFNITLNTLLTVLCIIFTRKNLRLYKLTPTRFICVLIVINLIWLWLQTQLDDAVDSKLFDEKYPSEICGGCKGNKSVLEALNDACCCVCRQTPILMYFDKASVFLYSFIVEYCLLAIECVLHFMLTMVEKEVTVLETISDDGSFHSTNQELSDWEGASYSTAYGEDGVNMQLFAKNTGMRSYGTVSNCGVSTPRTNSITLISPPNDGISNDGIRSNTFSKNKLLPIYATVTGITFTILTSLATFTDKLPHDDIKYTRVFYLVKLVLHLSTVMVTLTGFGISKSFTSHHTGYKGFEILLMFSTFGFFINVMFITWASVAYMLGTEQRSDILLGHSPQIDTTANIIYIVGIMVNMWQVYTQTAFMLHISKIKPSQLTGDARHTINTYKQVLLFMAIFNFWTWVQESFFELKYIEKVLPLQTWYYKPDVWAPFSHFIYPILMFYRFNSCIHFLEFYLNY